MSVKDIHIKPVDSSRADEFIKRHHYSGKVVQNSQLHLGAFYHGSLEGVMQFGPPLRREFVIDLVEGTNWNEMMELNRMAFSDKLPQNSESRSLSIAFKLFKKHAPQVKWVLSYADATECGDGAIYRASNFVLTGINKNSHILQLPDGGRINESSIRTSPNSPMEELGGRTPAEVCGGNPTKGKIIEETGAVPQEGYQLRYIYFIDNDYRDRLAVPEIPYERIDELDAGMYKGEKISIQERKP